MNIRRCFVCEYVGVFNVSELSKMFVYCSQNQTKKKARAPFL